MGRVKQKCDFEHAQNAQIPIHPARAQSRIRGFALRCFFSYDMKVVTKERSIAKKKFPPIVGFESGLPSSNHDSLTHLSEIEYIPTVTYKLCEICQGRLSKAGVIGRNNLP